MEFVFDTQQFSITEPIESLPAMLAQRGIGLLNATPAVLQDPRYAERVSQKLAIAGMRWFMMPTPKELLADFELDDAAFASCLYTLERWAKTAQQIGVSWCYSPVFPGSDNRDCAENFKWHVERVSRIYEVLRRYHIRYALEFVGPKTLRERFRYPFFDSIAGTMAIADAVDTSIGFVFDVFHWYCTGQRPDDLYYALANHSRMACLHINDAALGIGPEKQQDQLRALPGQTGVIDSGAVYRAFLKHGYNGAVMAEPLSPTRERFAEMRAADIILKIARCYTNIQQP